MLTGTGNEQTAVEAMKLGAGDYVVKDPAGGYLDLLPTIIRRVLEGHRLRGEKEAAEEALRESESRFRTVTETAADAILCSDSNGRIVLWNRAAERMLRYESSEAVGMPIRKLVPEALWAAAEPPHAFPIPTSDGAHPQHFESVVARKDGETVPVEVSITGWRTRSECFYTTIIRDISERKEYEERLAHMAHHDSLTGVFNRHYLATMLKRETDRAERYNHPIGFLMIDVDRLKMINDTLGHQIGDHVIVAVAEVIRSAVRRVDLVFRYGGDEFLVLLPETNGRTTYAKERILASLETWNRASSLLDFDVTLSIGVSHWTPGEGRSTDEALNQADAAMYREKRGESSSSSPRERTA
jgi:diguanylate cyclase (GGDEF)-like protein/PAS domain S-box-containing protein